MLAPFRFDSLMDSVPTRQMALDLAETDNDYKIKVDVPGMEKKDLSLDVGKNNTLIIKAERSTQREDAQYHVVERSYGSVSRTIRLPETADLETTTAKMENGVLEINVTKREKPPRVRNQITIQ